VLPGPRVAAIAANAITYVDGVVAEPVNGVLAGA
jgi:hypothetical protein